MFTPPRVPRPAPAPPAPRPTRPYGPWARTDRGPARVLRRTPAPPSDTIRCSRAVDGTNYLIADSTVAPELSTSWWPLRPSCKGCPSCTVTGTSIASPPSPARHSSGTAPKPVSELDRTLLQRGAGTAPAVGAHIAGSMCTREGAPMWTSSPTGPSAEPVRAQALPIVLRSRAHSVPVRVDGHGQQQCEATLTTTPRRGHLTRSET